MRTINSFKNIITGIGGNIITTLLQFVSRTVFISMLGKEYLGIQGLFTNILSVLSIAELGIGVAIVFSLYKPLADKDIKKAAATTNFLRKAYFLIGLIIAGLGMLLIPFLPYIIKGTTNLVNINIIYILYLLQTVSSYWFFAYKGLLLQADQKRYIVNMIRYFVTNIAVVFQILALVLSKSFIVYTIIGIAANICTNLIVARKANKMYPDIFKNKNETLPKDEKKEIFKNVFGVSMYKINSTVVRSTDNIVISAFVNTVAVGIYSNYHLIVNTLITMAKLIFSSFTASIGNLFVSDDKEKSEFIFRCLSFFAFWLYGFAAISLWILFNPFITLWIGREYLFADYIVLVIVIDFIMDGYQQVSIIFKDACGLFWRGKYRPLATAVLNVIISLILVPRMGVAGVLLGTIISRLLTTWWFEPWMVYKYAFNKSSKRYFVRYMSFFLLIVLIGGLVQVACMPFSANTWFNLVIKAFLCVLIPNSIIFLIFRKTEEFKYLVGAGKKVTKSVFKK